MIEDEKYMRRCLQLAQNGHQNAKPNPMVGAVIVSADGRIIGEGYHVRCGEGHAEVNAFASVKVEDEPLLSEATIYVSLEPCSHYGKTPPCADLIIKKGVRRVVVGCLDPFAEVQGRGVRKLREAGIEVEVGVLEKECMALNCRFFTFHREQRPYIILKWAQTANGFIDDHFKPVHAHPLNLESLHSHQIQSLIVEGGAKTLQSFIDKGLWDELRVEINFCMTVSNGTRAPLIPADAVVNETIRDGANQLVCYHKIIPER